MTRNLNREIASIAFPSILANITVPLVGMVDTAVAGHLTDGGAAALIGGIAIGSMLFDLLYWNFGFLRVSTGGLTAQAFGRWKGGASAGDCADTLVRSLVIAMASALLLIAVHRVFVGLAFKVVDCSEQVRSLACRYFFIRIWAAPATLSLMAFKGWFIGMQDSVSAMVVDLVVNTVNIAASVVLSLGLALWGGLGFDGVAWGTLVAQYSGLLAACALFVFKYGKNIVPLLRIRSVMKGEATVRFFSMNGNIFVRSLCFIAIYIGYTILSARYGDLMLATCSIMMKLLMIFSYFIDGFAYSAEAMCGKYIGERNSAMFRASVMGNLWWSAVLSVAFLAAYGFGGLAMVGAMTSDAQVMEASRHFIPWLMVMPLAGCAAFAWDGIYIGATATSSMRNAMLLATLSFFAVWFAGSALIGPEASAESHIHILMAAYFAHLLARGIFLTARSPGVIFRPNANL